MKIAIGSDHGGFALKEAVRKHLEEKGIEVEDFGCYSTESVDYAVYGAKVAHCGGGRRGAVRHTDLLDRHRHLDCGEQGEGHPRGALLRRARGGK